MKALASLKTVTQIVPGALGTANHDGHKLRLREVVAGSISNTLTKAFKNRWRGSHRDTVLNELLGIMASL